MDPHAPTADEINARLNDVGDHWWHSIDLGHGIVTRGTKSKEVLDTEMKNLMLPDLKGKSVLDIGAWDGAMSFEAERRGASRVVAMDSYVWSMDFEAQQHAITAAAGAPLQRWEDNSDVWHPESLPGKQRFDLAHWALGSHVEAVVEDLMTANTGALGFFDVTIFSGVLYHLSDPIGGLRKLSELTGDLAIIETELVHVAGYGNQPLWHYIEGDSLAGDPSNYWLPSKAGLAAALRDAGFRSVKFLPVLDGPPVLSPAGRVLSTVTDWARRTARSIRPSAPANFRQVVHARR